MRRPSHLTDDRLVNLCGDNVPTSDELTHLEQCDRCRARHTGLQGLLREVTDAAAVDADAAFPPERLAVQRARILLRVAQNGRPGHLLTFPAATSPGVRLFRVRPASRWVAAAAAAGLAVGLMVGRLTHTTPPSMALRAPATHGVTARVAPLAGLTPVSLVLSDDELLGEIEIAVAGPVAVLRPLHELTPAADQVWSNAR